MRSIALAIFAHPDDIEYFGAFPYILLIGDKDRKRVLTGAIGTVGEEVFIAASTHTHGAKSGALVFDHLCVRIHVLFAR